jgi:endopolyphosphatase
MNIDHFLLQDTEDVDLVANLMPETARESLQDDISISSKENYLLELRDTWSDIPGSAIKALMEEHGELRGIATNTPQDKSLVKRNKNLKKIGGKYAERYQVTLVGPSVVPNYFPTLRIVEYNITGLEGSPVWVDSNSRAAAATPLPLDAWDDIESHQELKRDVDVAGKKKKKKKPKKPHFVMPEDPKKSSLPGPGYSPQALTLTGYTQYYANLTYINNDLSRDEAGGLKWRDGDHESEQPEHKPDPREFAYEVEYSTFDDKVFKLKDLTVKNYLKLAYRLGRPTDGKSFLTELLGWDFDEEEGEELAELVRLYEEADDDFGDLQDLDDGEDEDEDEDDDEDNDDEMDAQGKKKKKKKKKKNKAWLRFLMRAFVSTMSKDDLKKL